MQKPQILSCILLLPLFVFGVACARADVKVTQILKIKQTQYAPADAQLPPGRPRGMSMTSDPIQFTSYFRGNDIRIDVPMSFELTKRNGATVTAMDPNSQIAEVQSFADLHNQLMPQLRVNASIKPNGKTRTILGHLCRGYAITSPHGSISIVSGELWIAEDLPALPAPMILSGFSGPLYKQWHSLHGMMMEANMKIEWKSPAHTVMLMNFASTAISDSPQSPSLFKIPAGYRKVSDTE